MSQQDKLQKVPFWNVNIPQNQWTNECPSYLAACDEFDQKILSTPDAEYSRLSWEEVKEVIRTNRLEIFKRTPSDLRRYRIFLANIKASHGSVMNFIMKERVKWEDITPNATPFQDDLYELIQSMIYNVADIKILYNDWPYGIDSKIVHLVVWVKFSFEEDPQTGDLTPKAREEIEGYVDRTFRKGSGSAEVTWFKNWAALKSVHALEHFHVMLYDPSPEFVQRITGGDVPMSRKV